MTAASLQTHSLPSGWRNDLDLFPAEPAAGMNGHILPGRRVGSVMALNAPGNRDLAAMGPRRSDIPAFIFADMLSEPG